MLEANLLLCLFCNNKASSVILQVFLKCGVEWLFTDLFGQIFPVRMIFLNGFEFVQMEVLCFNGLKLDPALNKITQLVYEKIQLLLPNSTDYILPRGQIQAAMQNKE